jgi:hypothetical protein
MLSLDALTRAAEVYDAIIAADAYREKVAAKGDKPDFGPWLAGLAGIVRAERPVVAGIIGTLEIIEAAMPGREAPTAPVCPPAANDQHPTSPEQPGPRIA